MTAIISKQMARNEGITTGEVNDSRLDILINLATQYINLATGNLFTKENITFLVDGSGTPTLFLPIPIISLSSMSVIDLDGTEETLNASYYKVYNRSGPIYNDRRNPKIVRVRNSDAPYEKNKLYEPKFPQGRQNIKLVGTFGFIEQYSYDKTITGATNAEPIIIDCAAHGYATGTVVTISGVSGNTAANGTWMITVIDKDTFSLDDSSGNAVYTGGGTVDDAWSPPQLIQRAAIMLIIRELDLLTNDNNRAKKDRCRITSESAQGHSYSLAELAIKGGVTGDWEIDSILAMYHKPIGVGVVI